MTVISGKQFKIGVTRPTDGLEAMFNELGFETVVLPFYQVNKDALPKLDLLAFSGGIDVAPELYGAARHPLTDHNQSQRDESDSAYLSHYSKIPKVGVCRGAQFLCVKGGGALYQHITDNDHNSPHNILDLGTGRVVKATSVHHQACITLPNWTLLATAMHTSMVEGTSREVIDAKYYVPEAFYIPLSNSLCVQFHPEYSNGQECRTYFLELMMRVFK